MEIGFQWRGPTYEFSILMKIQISIYLILTKYHKMKRYIGPVWYMCLKIKNCCLKTFVEIHVGEKVCGNT